MKIAIYHNIIAPGGAKRTLFEEVKYLSAKHQLDLYTLSTSDKLSFDLTPYLTNTKIYKYLNTITAKGIVNRGIKDFKDFFVLKRLHKTIAQDIDNGGYDVVLVHLDSFTESPYLLRYLKTKSLYYSQSYLRIGYDDYVSPLANLKLYQKIYERINRILRRNIDKNNAKCASKIHTSSKFMKKRLDLYYDRKTICNYLGVHTDIFKPYDEKKENKIIFVGDKNRLKGFDTAILALKGLDQKENLKLVTLGTSGGLRIDNDTKLAKYYSKALFTLCLGREEPFGLSVVESMSCGTPVVAVSEGGYLETVDNEKTGFLVKRNKLDIAYAIGKLLSNKNNYLKMSRKARERVINTFTWERHCKLLERDLELLRL